MLAQQPLQVVGVVVGEPFQGRPAGPGDHRAVVDRLVGPGVQQDGAAVGQDRDDGGVDMGEGGQQQGVLNAEQLPQLGLDLLVQHRAAEHPRPAGMGAPAVQVGRDALDDLAVEVEPQVVAGGEVVQPAVSDADAASVDLVDHGIKQGVPGLQTVELGAGP